MALNCAIALSVITLSPGVATAAVTWADFAAGTIVGPRVSKSTPGTPVIQNLSFGDGASATMTVSITSGNGNSALSSTFAPTDFGTFGQSESGLVYNGLITVGSVNGGNGNLPYSYRIEFSSISNPNNNDLYLFLGQQGAATTLSGTTGTLAGSTFQISGGSGAVAFSGNTFSQPVGGDSQGRGSIISIPSSATEAVFEIDTIRRDVFSFSIGGDVQPVPEPGNSLLFALSAVTFLKHRRRQRS